VSLTAEPVDAQTAEKWGLVNRVVNPTELLDTAKAIAKAILKNQERMTLEYKATVKDGFRLPFVEALKLEKVCSLITILDHMTNQAPVNMHNATASFFSLATV
jgi:enoyl-CoA hydratase/carnithine racemase